MLAASAKQFHMVKLFGSALLCKLEMTREETERKDGDSRFRDRESSPHAAEPETGTEKENHGNQQQTAAKKRNAKRLYGMAGGAQKGSCGNIYASKEITDKIDSEPMHGD